jgi:hypothetical protein
MVIEDDEILDQQDLADAEALVGGGNDDGVGATG